MNQINPLHIAVLLLTLLVFLSMQLGQKKEELLEANKAYQETLALASKVGSLNQIYKDKKRVKKSLFRVLKQPSLKFIKIQQKVMKSGVILTGASMNKKELNSLMGKIMNGSYNISALKIKKIAKDKVSFMMEIKW